MTTYRFIAQALTPIHVGCGTEIDPTAFVLQDDHLIQFSPAQVIEDLSDQERGHFIELSERADLKQIQNFLKTKVVAQRHALARIDISSEFRREFETKASNPGNQFRVEMMSRGGHTARVYLPGSSLKGAIRTAVVNFFANEIEAIKTQVHEAVKVENIKDKAKRLEEKALNRKAHETEKDLFRLIHVEDAVLPDGATRIDKAQNHNPGKPGAEGIQMWFERVKSLADSPTPPTFSIAIRIDERAMNNDKVNQIIGRTLDIQTLMLACNQFYWNRMRAEGDKFDGRTAEGPHWKAIHGCFPKGRLGNDIVAIDPSQPFWNNADYGMHYVLLRVGRFSHFESLSVDNLRQGYNIKARQPIHDMGATRTRCMMDNIKPPMPYGWLLLKLEEPLD